MRPGYTSLVLSSGLSHLPQTTFPLEPSAVGRVIPTQPAGTRGVAHRPICASQGARGSCPSEHLELGQPGLHLAPQTHLSTGGLDSPCQLQPFTQHLYPLEIHLHSLVNVSISKIKGDSGWKRQVVNLSVPSRADSSVTSLRGESEVPTAARITRAGMGPGLPGESRPGEQRGTPTFRRWWS